MIRNGKVNEVILTSASDAPTRVRMAEVAALGATPAELAAVGDLLAKTALDTLVAAGKITPAPSQADWLLGLTWHQAHEAARRIFAIGNAVGWLADTLGPSWADPASARTLADVLKVLPPERLEHVRTELEIAGLEIEIEDGD